MQKTILILVNLIMFIAFTNCSNIDQKIEMMNNKKIESLPNETPIDENNLPLEKLNARLETLNKNTQNINDNLNNIKKEIHQTNELLLGLFFLVSGIMLFK